jgi:hypothetical protein
MSGNLLSGYAKLRIEESKEDNRMILSFLDFFVRDADRPDDAPLNFSAPDFAVELFCKATFGDRHSKKLLVMRVRRAS